MKCILLAITGSIAAYKTPEIVRLLKKEGYTIDIILTPKALNYVTIDTLKTINNGNVYTDNDIKNNTINHITLTKRNQLLVVLPCTANSIAKFATGICNNLVSMTFLEFNKKKLLFPCMHESMYQNNITQKNIGILKNENNQIIEPDTGDLACGDFGTGRLTNPEKILQLINNQVESPLKNKKVIITCGGTSEPIDPIRIITNKSTGKQGLALAKKALELGAEVTLITSIDTTLPVQQKIIVSSHEDLSKAIDQEIKSHSHIYMAAAVSDFTCKTSKTKLKRANQELTLVQTPDILKTIKKKNPKIKVIGFCLTDKDLEKETKRKCTEKNCDIMIGNHPNVIGEEKRSIIISKKNADTVKKINDTSLDIISEEILMTKV